MLSDRSAHTALVTTLALYLIASTREQLWLFCVVTRRVRSFCPTRRELKILVFLLATERSQLQSVHFEPLLLEARSVLFGTSIS